MNEHPYDLHEEALLAQAFRTLLDDEHFDTVLQQVAEYAREHSGCRAAMLIAVLDEATPPDVPAGPWCAGVDGPLDPSARASLTMPVVTDGLAATGASLTGLTVSATVTGPVVAGGLDPSPESVTA